MQTESPHFLTHYFEIARYKWIFVLSVGLFLGFFLLAFQPFGVNNFDPSFHVSLEFFVVILSFSTVICAALAVSEFFLRPLVFKQLTPAQMIAWLAWDYLLVCTVAFFYYNFLGNWHDLRWSSYFGFIRDVSLVITFPIAAFLFYVRHESLKSEFVELRSLKARTPSAELVHFSSDNGKDRFSVALEDLLYLESQDNYVAVVHMDNGKPRSTLIRTSLKRLETMLQEPGRDEVKEAGNFGFPLLRCHRSFMVNLSRVRTCQGNRHGLKLTLEGGDRVIPVSRAFTVRLLEELDARQPLE